MPRALPVTMSVLDAPCPFVVGAIFVCQWPAVIDSSWYCCNQRLWNVEYLHDLYHGPLLVATWR